MKLTKFITHKLAISIVGIILLMFLMSRSFIVVGAQSTDFFGSLSLVFRFMYGGAKILSLIWYTVFSFMYMLFLIGHIINTFIIVQKKKQKLLSKIFLSGLLFVSVVLMIIIGVSKDIDLSIGWGLGTSMLVLLILLLIEFINVAKIKVPEKSIIIEEEQSTEEDA